MSGKAGFWNAIFFAWLLVFGVPSVFAETQALQKLLEVLEQKGVLSPEEVRVIRQAMSEDLRSLKAKQKEFEKRERELTRREKELVQRASSLQSAAQPPAEVHPSAVEAQAGEELKAYYDQGVCLRATDPYDLSLCLGGLLQTDYRYFKYDEGNPNNNGFDIRRARLQLGGHVLRHFDYRFLYEFAGAQSRNLLDAYLDFNASPSASLRAGQFKEPFSLEQVSSEQDLFFAERSMAYYLMPRRDIGSCFIVAAAGSQTPGALAVLIGLLILFGVLGILESRHREN